MVFEILNYFLYFYASVKSNDSHSWSLSRLIIFIPRSSLKTSHFPGLQFPQILISNMNPTQFIPNNVNLHSLLRLDLENQRHMHRRYKYHSLLGFLQRHTHYLLARFLKSSQLEIQSSMDPSLPIQSSELYSQQLSLTV